jgi:hypothetical protein
MHDDPLMRTTLDLDDDVLQAAKELAAARRTTAGRIVSELLRQAMAPARKTHVRNGVPLLPARPPGSGPLTLAVVNRLRDE